MGMALTLTGTLGRGLTSGTGESHRHRMALPGSSQGWPSAGAWEPAFGRLSPSLMRVARRASPCAPATCFMLDVALPRGWNCEARWAEGACGCATAEGAYSQQARPPRVSQWLSNLVNVQVAVGTVKKHGHPIHDSPKFEVLPESWTGLESKRDPARSSGDQVLVLWCEKEFKARTNSTQETRVY